MHTSCCPEHHSYQQPAHLCGLSGTYFFYLQVAATHQRWPCTFMPGEADGRRQEESATDGSGVTAALEADGQQPCCPALLCRAVCSDAAVWAANERQFLPWHSTGGTTASQTLILLAPFASAKNFQIWRHINLEALTYMNQRRRRIGGRTDNSRIAERVG